MENSPGRKNCWIELLQPDDFSKIAKSGCFTKSTIETDPFKKITEIASRS
jgi:hypothetical protein